MCKKIIFLAVFLLFSLSKVNAETITLNYKVDPNDWCIGPSCNYRFGKLDIIQDGRMLYRETFGNHAYDTCAKGKIPVEISNEKDYLVITESHPVRGCGLRYFIRKDGSGGYTQTLNGGVWKNQDLERILTPEKLGSLKSLEKYATATNSNATSIADASLSNNKPVVGLQQPNISQATQEADRLALENRIREQVRLELEVKAKEQARLDQEAKLKEQARIQQDAKAKEQIRLQLEAKAQEQARVDQEAKLKEQARIQQDAKAKEQIRLELEAKAQEQARMDQEAKLKEQSRIVEDSNRLASQKKKDEEFAKLQNELDQLKKQLSSTQNLGARKALVIGNDSYRSVTRLQNAREDAKAVAEMLTFAGWKVSLKLDLTEKEMKTALRSFKNDINPGDETTFFYAGHGVQFGTSNYLLPIDTSGDSEEQVRDDAIPLQRILDDMIEKKAKFTLALLDACRDNPFKTAGRSIGGGTRGLAPTSAATGQMVVFSAGNGQQALDNLGGNDKNKNGLFTRIFLQEARKKGQTIDLTIKNVRSEVARLARSVGHDQVPAIYDQVLGDFYFMK